MSNPRGLWKTTIVVWSDFDPRSMESSELVRDGETGDSLIEESSTDFITDKSKWPDIDFFGDDGVLE